jgi:hypothetical protein
MVSSKPKGRVPVGKDALQLLFLLPQLVRYLIEPVKAHLRLRDIKKTSEIYQCVLFYLAVNPFSSDQSK